MVHEAAVFSLVGTGFGLFYLANQLQQEDKWIAAAKILLLAGGAFSFIVSLFVGWEAIGGTMTYGPDLMTWVMAFLCVAFILFIFLAGVTWFIRMVQGWIPRGKRHYGDQEGYSHDAEG